MSLTDPCLAFHAHPTRVREIILDKTKSDANHIYEHLSHDFTF